MGGGLGARLFPGSEASEVGPAAASFQMTPGCVSEAGGGERKPPLPRAGDHCGALRDESHMRGAAHQRGAGI